MGSRVGAYRLAAARYDEICIAPLNLFRSIVPSWVIHPPPPIFSAKRKALHQLCQNRYALLVSTPRVHVYMFHTCFMISVGASVDRRQTSEITCDRAWQHARVV